MNFNINPCHDFYTFSCGNYDTLVKPRKGKGVASGPYNIQIDIEEAIHRFLQSNVSVADDRILKIIKNIYQPCTDVRLINGQGVEPLWSAIWMTGGFPVVDGDNWDEKGFSIGNADYKSRKNGFTGQQLFRSYVAEDKKRPNKYSIYIAPPQFQSLPGHELITEDYSEKLRVNYLSFIVRLTFHLLNEPDYEDESHTEIRKKFEDELNKTLNFKLDLGKYLNKFSTDQDTTDMYNKMTLDSLQVQIPYVDWASYFRNMLPRDSKVPKEVIVVGASYFKDTKHLIEKTPKRVLGNFLMIENAFEGSLFLPEDFFSIYNKFRANIGMQSAIRRPFCEAVVKNTMRGALSSLFIETYKLTEGSQKILEDITNNVNMKLKQSIQNAQWMDKETKQMALLKLKHTKLRLSLSDSQLLELHDAEARARFYEELCLGKRKSHVLPSYFCINKFHLKKNWELLERAPTVFDGDIDVFTPQVQYIQDQNELLVPYSILKYPLFDEVWPQYLNYGGIGSILGSVITSGYDKKGARFNDMGFSRKWWTSNTTNLYQEQSECLLDEYITFAKRDSNVSVSQQTGKIVLENLADFEGANLAYQAYDQYWKSRYLKEQSLPGLHQFSSEQLFFIGFANTYCANYKPAYLKYVLKQGDEVPYTLRVVGGLQNLKSFATAFKCRQGTQMNPQKKCKLLWNG